MTPHQVGRWGEVIAARHLVQAGWIILDRNFRAGRKEVDIVARQDGMVIFVEVKTRRSLGCGHPLEAITHKKRREIAEVARHWLSRNPGAAQSVRFDAISVLAAERSAPLVEHLTDAWRVGV